MVIYFFTTSTSFYVNILLSMKKKKPILYVKINLNFVKILRKRKTDWVNNFCGSEKFLYEKNGIYKKIKSLDGRPTLF